MRMNGIFFGSLFWGILISLIGVSIILKYAFNIDLHLIRIFFGIILILFGIKLITGFGGRQFVKKSIHYNTFPSGKDYDIVFSNRTLDLSKYQDINKMPKEINVVFGNGAILVPDNINLEVTSTTVFGSTIMPDRSYAGFGEDIFLINNNPDSPTIRITTSTVFGRLSIEVIPSKPTPESNTQNDNF